MKLTILAALAMAASALAETFEFDAKHLPYSFEVEAPSAGYVRVEIDEKPKGFTPSLRFAEAKEWPISKDYLEARVEPGRTKFVLAETYTGAPQGTVRFRAEFDPERDVTEPNGEPSKARTVKLGERVTMCLRPRGDHDWVKLEVPEPGYLLATFEGAGRHIEAVLHIEEGIPLATNLARVDYAGGVLVLVRDHYGSAQREDFSVTFTFTLEDDPFEPNDTADMAADIEIGEWHRARVSPSGDGDWFAFSVDRDGWIQMDTPPLKGFFPQWGLARAEKPTEKTWGDVQRVSAGEYRLELSDQYGYVTPEARPFRVRFLPEPDTTGPNDDPANPAAVATDAWHRIGLFTGGDKDHVAFTLARDAVVRLELEGPRPKHLVAALLAEDASESRFGDGPRRLPAGRHRLVFRTDYGSRLDQAFGFRLSVEEETDPDEPNDTADRALPLTLGASRPVRLGPGESDEDWFVFDVPKDGLLYVITSEDTQYPEKPAGVELYNAAGERTADLLQHPARMNRVAAVTKGTWRLRVFPQRFAALPQQLKLFATLVAQGDTSAAAAGTPDFALIGLEVDEGTMTALRALARDGGASFTDTKNLADLQKEIQTIIEKKKEEAKREEVKPVVRARPVWPWIAAGGGGALILAAVVVFLVIRRGRAS